MGGLLESEEYDKVIVLRYFNADLWNMHTRFSICYGIFWTVGDYLLQVLVTWRCLATQIHGRDFHC